MAKRRKRGTGGPRRGGAENSRGGLVQQIDAILGAPAARIATPLVLSLLAFVLGAACFDSKLSISGDNTEFITLARGIALGEGLSHVNLPQPEPATKYPFGFPLMLAALEVLAPGNWMLMKWFVVILFALAVPIFHALVRDQLGATPALLAATILLSMPLLLAYSHQVMSDIPYLTFSLLALLLLERSMRRDDILRNGWLWGGFVCLIWTYYVRSVGLMLVVAFIAYLLIHRAYRKAAVIGGASILATSLSVIRNQALGGKAVYLLQLAQVNPYRPELGYLNAAQLAARVGANINSYLNERLPGGFWTFVDLPLGKIASVVVVLIAAGAAVMSIRRRKHLLLAIYSILVLGTVLVWPWTSARFLIPVIPIAIFFLAVASRELIDRTQRGGVALVGWTLLGGAYLLLLGLNLGAVPRLTKIAASDYPIPWQRYHAAAEWLKANTPDDTVIACRKAFWMFVVSGRRSVGYRFEAPDSLIAGLEQDGADYVVVDPLGFSSTPEYLIPAVSANKDKFEIVWHQPNPDTYIIRFLGRRRAVSDDLGPGP